MKKKGVFTFVINERKKFWLTVFFNFINGFVQSTNFCAVLIRRLIFLKLHASRNGSKQEKHLF
jgi:hypothetical protein